MALRPSFRQYLKDTTTDVRLTLAGHGSLLFLQLQQLRQLCY